MSNFVPSFLNGADLIISIGGHQVAFATGLAFEDTVVHTPVGGIGSYSFSTIEPVQYIVRGSFNITHYTQPVIDALNEVAGSLPHRAVKNTGPSTKTGNTLLTASQFSPVHLFSSKTFDIVIKERRIDPPSDVAGEATAELSNAFVIYDCRMTNYSMNFAPGSLVTETVAFMAIYAEDKIATMKATAST